MQTSLTQCNVWQPSPCWRAHCYAWLFFLVFFRDVYFFLVASIIFLWLGCWLTFTYTYIHTIQRARASSSSLLLATQNGRASTQCSVCQPAIPISAGPFCCSYLAGLGRMVDGLPESGVSFISLFYHLGFLVAKPAMSSFGSNIVY